MTIESLWTFVTEQLGVVVSWLILASVVGYLGLALLFAIWAEREERRQAEQVARFNRVMQAQQQHESQVWPRPKGPHGFQQGQGRR